MLLANTVERIGKKLQKIYQEEPTFNVSTDGKKFLTQVLSKVHGLKKKTKWYSDWLKKMDHKNGL